MVCVYVVVGGVGVGVGVGADFGRLKEFLGVG